MAAVEHDLSVRLQWGAVNHHDTDNPHAHVVVRGVDMAGRQVRIDRAYISNWMRWQAQHILTADLGPRLAFDVERQLDREVGQERLTSLDHRLAGQSATFMHLLAATTKAPPTSGQSSSPGELNR
jgi:type IV secretory pathway VirD2 relaxase